MASSPKSHINSDIDKQMIRYLFSVWKRGKDHDPQMLFDFLDQGASVHAYGSHLNQHHSLLTLSLLRKTPTVWIKTILERGAVPDGLGKDDFLLPIVQALKNGDEEQIDLLLSCELEHTPFYAYHHAIRAMNVTQLIRVYQKLYDRKFSLHLKDSEFKTLTCELVQACYMESTHAEVFKWILNKVQFQESKEKSLQELRSTFLKFPIDHPIFNLIANQEFFEPIQIKDIEFLLNFPNQKQKAIFEQFEKISNLKSFDHIKILNQALTNNRLDFMKLYHEKHPITAEQIEHGKRLFTLNIKTMSGTRLIEKSMYDFLCAIGEQQSLDQSTAQVNTKSSLISRRM